MSNLVFVYGTLKEGHGNHTRLLKNREGVEKLGEYYTPPEYTMYSLRAFPGVRHEGNTSITGEVYRVSDEVFKDLDRLEGYPSFYNREKMTTPYGEAWIYLINEGYNNLPIVEKGVW